MAYIRNVRTASGAVAVQVVAKRRGRVEVLEHVGSATTDAELALLRRQAREVLQGQQLALNIEVPAFEPRLGDVADWTGRGGRNGRGVERQGVSGAGSGRTVGTASRLLYEVIGAVFDSLGFDALGDAVFRDLVIARIVEPTSKRDAGRVLVDLGAKAASYATIKRHLRAVIEDDYRAKIAELCYAHAQASGDISLVLYDVTTLYFEAEDEDDLRKVGYSKERRVDPQIVVGLLVDRAGFPLEIGCFEGDKAETLTLIPMIEQFADRHDLADFVVEASFRMSKSDLQARPMFHRVRDSIEAHLTIVFTALAVAREMQRRSQQSIKAICNQLRPLRSATLTIGGHTQTFPPELNDQQKRLIDDLTQPGY